MRGRTASPILSGSRLLKVSRLRAAELFVLSGVRGRIDTKKSPGKEATHEHRDTQHYDFR